ncbi:MAG: type II toxin-antitoxin system Phd/YefM family antitoxin [Actinomycetota bacterium]
MTTPLEGQAMPEIGVKKLKAKASSVTDEVSAGASYVVTKRGLPAAVVVPIEDAEDLASTPRSTWRCAARPEPNTPPGPPRPSRTSTERVGGADYAHHRDCGRSAGCGRRR